MRLRRVEAVRFGQLENESLGDLGDGLTVVFGPNEAGKSTYTALVRHVLYGFPTPAAKEPRYLSAAGKRHGRLMFENPDGRWVVERVEGPHGGAVTVSAVEGVEHPSLLDEVRHGVSQDAFRIVFGFGLAEMAQIEELRGAEEGVVARLYAAGAGLAVPPQDVRAAIDKQTEELFAPRAAARVANRAHARMREIRSRLRTLEDEASRYASDQATLADLRGDLEEARTRRDAAAVRNRELERSAGLVEEREREIESLDRQLLEARRSVAQMIVQRDAIAPDEGLIAAGPKVDAMLAELAAHRDRLQRLTTMESALADTERRLEAQSGQIGLSASNLPDLSPDAIAGVERWRDSLARAELEAGLAEKTARDAQQRARAAEEAAAAGAGTRPSERTGWLPAIATALAGAVAVAVGLVTSTNATTIVGGGLLAVGAALALWQYRRPVRGDMTADGLRRSEQALTARAEATAAEETAAQAAGDLVKARDTWTDWLAENGLEEGGSDPLAVGAFLAEVKELRRMRQETAAATQAVRVEREAADAYASTLASLASPFVDGVVVLSPAEALTVAERLRERLSRAREAREARDRLSDKLGEAEADLVALEEARTAAYAAVRTTLTAYGLADAGLAALLGLADVAQSDASHAENEFEELATRIGTIEGRLGLEGRETEMGELRLELTSLEEELSDAASKYAVLGVASRLLTRAQERYERERQPDVVRSAQDIFRRITADRFTGLAIPLGSGEIRVVGKDSSIRHTEELSRGTAEQLYLALRLALVGQLAEVGPGLPVLMDDVLVNFDEERRVGAARAIADLARLRQVVVFTCHAETAEVLEAADPARTLLELDRCSL